MEHFFIIQYQKENKFLLCLMDNFGAAQAGLHEFEIPEALAEQIIKAKKMQSSEVAEDKIFYVRPQFDDAFLKKLLSN